MRNPFQEKFEEDVNDSTYVTRSLHGDGDALEALVLRHQSWIYNIAFSMMHDIHDAEDAIQEVLIKVITAVRHDPANYSSNLALSYCRQPPTKIEKENDSG
jgi:DNA-directed RNA polymerase specialized sigma24 family protein